MRKERIKSIILVLLILNCLQLTGQIWFNKKLWPGGYNFFAFNFSTTVPDAVKPRELVINGGNAREVYYPGQKQYSDAYKIINTIITSFVDASDLRSGAVSNEEWKSFLKGKSLLLNYGYNMDADSFAGSFGKTVSSFPYTGTLSDVLITGDSVTNETIVCIYDGITGTAIKYWIAGNGERILKHIESATFGKNHDKSFAFEMFWDQKSEKTSIERNVLIDSFVLLPMDNENITLITDENPLEKDIALFDGIVSALGYTPSALRKSVSKNDLVASYVENSATIKISPSGVIEYNAVDFQRGILLQGGKTNSFNVVNKVLEIVGRIYRQAGIEDIPNLYISSDLIMQKGETFAFKMNYSYNGKPVFIYANNGKAPIDAIYAQVEGGYLKSFKMLVRTFHETNEAVTVTPVITAFDKLAKQFDNSGQVTVTDIFKCYAIKDNSAKAAWGIQTNSKGQNIIIINADD